MVCRYSRTEGRVVMVMVVAMVCTWSDGNVCEVDMSVCVSVCVTQCVCVCVCVCVHEVNRCTLRDWWCGNVGGCRDVRGVQRGRLQS